jgi:hypothetical protein
MMGPAGLAGEIEEFDQRHLGSDLPLLFQEDAAAPESDQPKGGFPDQRWATVHVRLPSGKLRRAVIAAKAAKDRKGIGRPKIFCAGPEQEGPSLVQGATVSAISRI